MVQDILDPQPEVDLSANPFFAAGMAGMDRLKWEYEARVSAEIERQRVAAEIASKS